MRLAGRRRLPALRRPLAAAARSLSTALTATGLAVICLAACLAPACYDGHGPLEPPPGTPGGLCHEPGGFCDQQVWTCEPIGRYCYDPAAPCTGVFCGEHGICMPDAKDLPTCVCDPGYSNDAYALYCDEP